MTPLQFVKAECSNYLPDSGGCKGILIEDDGTQSRMNPVPRFCLLAAPGQRCRFFEDCVAPMAGRLDDHGAKGTHPSGRKFDTVHQVAKSKLGYLEAVTAYRKSCLLPCASERPCPMCGRPLEPRHQFCEICQAKRRKDQNSRQARK